MKKLAKIILIAISVLLISFMISIPIVNDYSASEIEKRLMAIPLPENTEYVDSISKAGKMTGNGNGMQYFGAVLVKSELSLDELSAYYSAYRENDWDCLVEIQEGQQIEVTEHGSLSFETSLSAEEQYYILYSWGSGIEPFSELDIRGH